MAELFLPTLHTFAMNNIFTGSKGLFRFRAEPKVVMANPKEVDFAQSAIHVEYWHGLYCYEKSTMEGECTFPMSEEGREESQVEARELKRVTDVAEAEREAEEVLSEESVEPSAGSAGFRFPGQTI